MKYKRALPDFDVSYGKYILNKTVGLTKPTARIVMNVAVGIVATILFGLVGWVATVGVWYYGFYVGSFLQLLNVSKIHDGAYQGYVGPIPWLIGVGTFVVPIAMYYIGAEFTKNRL